MNLPLKYQQDEDGNRYAPITTPNAVIWQNGDDLDDKLGGKQDTIDSSNKLAASNISGLATVATSGSYNDLSGKPTIPAAQVQSDWNATTGMGVILNKPTIPDVSGKEDKMAIDSTAKTASFTASVGNYYTVNIAASGSVTITLTTPTDNTHISNAVFLVTTSTSPALTFSAASGVDIYVSSSYSIEASKVYEINALWNGVNWSIASVELDVQS